MPVFTRRDVLRTGAASLTAPLWWPWLSDAEAQEKPAKPDPYADAVFRDGPPPMPQKDSFTVAVLPDTQNYCQNVPETFFSQTKWIVEQRAARNIVSVLHLGDITNRNTPEQWAVAQPAMQQLDGHVPYFMAPGNHDYSDGGRCTDRTTRFNEYFPLAAYKDRPTFGGVYDKEPDRYENSFHRFMAGGRKFLVICLEFGPRADVVRWAGEIAERHADHEAILVTHAYMYYDETRYDWTRYGSKQRWNPHAYGVAKATGDDVSDGEELWQKLVSTKGKFILTLNGHVLEDGLGRTHTPTPAGRDIHQVLVNFQMKPKGGDGWLRLLEFRADGKTVEVYDYSPTRNECNDSKQNRFTMTTSA